MDGVLLLVDAQEGPKPQTRFVLKKALAMGHRVLVVVNKIDKPASRPEYVVDKTFDLFCELGASDEQVRDPAPRRHRPAVRAKGARGRRLADRLPHCLLLRHQPRLGLRARQHRRRHVRHLQEDP